MFSILFCFLKKGLITKILPPQKKKKKRKGEKTPLFSRAESGSGIQISPLQSLQACLASKHKKKNLSNLRTKASSDTDDPVREKTRTSILDVVRFSTSSSVGFTFGIICKKFA